MANFSGHDRSDFARAASWPPTPVIARSEATKQSMRRLNRGLLRYARNDGADGAEKSLAPGRARDLRVKPP